MDKTFFEHLEELRHKLFASLLIFITAWIFCAVFFDSLAYIFLKDAPKNLIFISPSEGFAVILQMSLFLALLVSFPAIAYISMNFIFANSSSKFKKAAYLLVPILLFYLGVLFSYFFLIPFGMQFILSFGSKYFIPAITASNYFGFFITFLLIGGILFELPAVLILLKKLGMINATSAAEKRAHFIVGSFILGAAITPADGITQFIVAVPLIILYEISILLMRFV